MRAQLLLLAIMPLSHPPLPADPGDHLEACAEQCIGLDLHVGELWPSCICRAEWSPNPEIRELENGYRQEPICHACRQRYAHDGG